MKKINRCFIPPKQSFFLFGPRGTGKSTYLKEEFPNALYINLLLSKERDKYEAFPDALIGEVEALGSELRVVVIDEIQKVPALLSTVHSLIEEHKNVQFILTGSSARKLKEKGVNLLAGRALLRHLHPFMASELGGHFDLEKALRIGMLPLVFQAEDPLSLLESYSALYIDEEVRKEALVRQVGQFARFLQVIAFSHGQSLNLTNIARECAVKRGTVENFLSILEDLLLSVRLPLFTHKAQRELQQHPKFYLFDAGVYRAIRTSSVRGSGLGPLDSEDEFNGASLEGLVLQHLLAWRDYTRERHHLYFWRTKAGLEVDFIVYGELGFWAIEVKNSENLAPSHVHGLLHFCEDYKEATPLLLYRGERRQSIKGVLALPVQEFLNSLQQGKVLV